MLTIDIRGYWHSGTGRGSGSHLDALVDTAHDGLPYLSGRHIKGLLRDANGLPAVPGSSLAGALRSLFKDAPRTPDCETVFGYADGNEGWPSRVHVSWGAIHNAQDRLIQGLLLGKATKRLEDDPLLASVTGVSPLIRDHIRIHHRGAGDDKGKFDRTTLHSGHRFSVEVTFWSKGDHCSEAARDRDIRETLLRLFSHPGFRLGGHTRRGLGAVKVARMHEARFDLSKIGDYQHYCALPNGLGETEGLTEIPITESNHGWIGYAPLLQAGKEADLLPITEPRVYWEGGRGELGPPRVLIPASGIKGPLAHRVAFHYDCLTRKWATAERCNLDHAPGETPPTHTAVAALFGHAKRKDEEAPPEPDQPAAEVAPAEQERGRAGWIYLDDIYLDRGLSSNREVHRQWHNGIDRFTGGVRNHVLYGEELIWRNTLKIELRIDPRARTLGINHRKALALALEDLCEGRLAIGGGSGKGHGYCQGKLRYVDNQRFGVRDLTNGAIPFYRQYLTHDRGNRTYEPLSKAGWLRFEDGGWRLIPCEHARVEHHDLRT
jgi:CRISPR/Cas system CSM-associated protein Csm3 (group 7 of RAMP superfamily)